MNGDDSSMEIEYQFKDLTMNDVKEIESWTYQGFMKSIDMTHYNKNFKEKGIVKGPLMCDGYGVFCGDQLCGLFECYWKKDGLLEIGLALNPAYVGKHMSISFINEGIQFVVKNHHYNKGVVTLTVDEKNIAAHKAYLSAGFREISRNDEGEILMEKIIKK
jgi:ribosomal-protein-alanine N-acetyltransferase